MRNIYVGMKLDSYIILLLKWVLWSLLSQAKGEFKALNSSLILDNVNVNWTVLRYVNFNMALIKLGH